MLTDFLSDLLEELAAISALGWGRAVVGTGLGGGGITDAEGARNPLRGVLGKDLVGLGIPPVLLRVLLIGRVGKAMVGGAFPARCGRGSVVVIV